VTSSESLIHDVASVTAMHIVEIFAGCLREEEQRDAYVEVLVAVKAGLECFQIQENRRQRRMQPGVN
jgi:hypothetical protein